MTTNQTSDPFAGIDPAPAAATPAAAADTQLAKLHTHEIAIQRVEALAGTTIEADGEKAVDAVRKSAKAVRCEIDSCRKSLNADALDWQRRVNDLAKRLTARVSPIEDAMQAQLDRVAKEKADRIRQAQAAVHAERLQQLQARHGEWGVSELRATTPLSLVGYTPESWAALLDTLDTRRKEQEIAARKRAEAEAIAAKNREEAQRIAREEQAKRAEEMRLRMEAEAQAREEARKQAHADRQRREHEWAASEEQRIATPQIVARADWFRQLSQMINDHIENGKPIISVDVDSMMEMRQMENQYLLVVRRILELDARPLSHFA